MRGLSPPLVVQPARQAASAMTSTRLGTLIVPQFSRFRDEETTERGNRQAPVGHRRACFSCRFSDLIGGAAKAFKPLIWQKIVVRHGLSMSAYGTKRTTFGTSRPRRLSIPMSSP